MSLLTRLRARPAGELAIALAVVSRSMLGWLVAFPAISAVSALGIGSLEAGERALFAPSGLLLVELLRLGQTSFSAAATTALVLLSVALVLHSLPTALLFSAFSHRERDFRRAFSVALGTAPRFVLLGGGELALAGLVALVSVALWPALPAEGSAARDVGMALVVACGLALVCLVAIIADLARADVVAAEGSFGQSLRRALESFRGAPLASIAGYALSTGFGALCVALGARAVELCRVELDGPLRVTLAFLVHQSALLGLTLIQAGWAQRLGQINERSS